MGVYPALPGAAEARIRATRELLLAAESAEARIDPDLQEIFRTYRRMADHAQSVFGRRLERAQRDERERNRVERQQYDVVSGLASRAEALTDGTSGLELPTDLRRFLRITPRRDPHHLVFRSVPANTYGCQPRSHPVADFLEGLPGVSVPAALRSRRRHMVSVLDIPRSYRRAMLTHLVMVGHEVGHIEDHAVGRIGDRFKRETIVGRVVTGQAARILPALRPLRKSSASLVLELIRNWSPEVFCDLYCIRRLGPAGLLVFAEYGRVAGIFLGDLSRRRSEDGKEDVEERFREHPPGEIRIALMIEELVALGYTIGQSPLDGPYGKIVAGWREVTGGGRDALVRLPEEFGRAYRLIRGHIHGPLRQELIRRIPDAQAYGPARLAYARTLAADLAQGIAMSERIEADGSRTILEVEDLYNAAAFVRFVQLDELAARVPGDERLSREQRRGAALETLDLLLTRAIEGARIAADWAEASSAIKARRR